MESDRSLNDLVTELGRRGATIRFGPKRPNCQIRWQLDQLAEFFCQYPFLREDVGYIQFLEWYDGVSYEDPREFRVLGIPGYGHFSTDILANGYPILDESGNFQICSFRFIPGSTGTWRDLTTHAYYFDAIRTRGPGVYRSVIRAEPGSTLAATTPTFVCSNFLELLRLLVEHRGQVP